MPCSYIIEAQGKRYRRTRNMCNQYTSTYHPSPKIPFTTVYFKTKTQSHTDTKAKPSIFMSFKTITRSNFKAPLPHSVTISRPKPKATQIPKPSPSIFMSFKTITRSNFKAPLPHSVTQHNCSYCLPQCRYLLLHLSTLSPLPSASASSEITQTPSAPQLALTPPVTLEELDAESPPIKCGSTIESDSTPSSLDSQASTASYSLCPRLPITYIKAALNKLQGRPEVRTFHNLSIPLPITSNDSEFTLDSSDDDDPTEAEADSSPTQKELPAAVPEGTDTSSSAPQMTHPTRSS